MSAAADSWPSLVTETEIPANIDAVASLIPDLETEVDGYDTLVRVEHILRYLETELKLRDPLLFPGAILSQIETDLTTIHSRLSTWLGSKNPQHETNLTASVDTLVTRFASIPVSRAESTPDEELATLRRSFGQYRRRAEEAVSETEERAAKAASEFQTAASTATNKQVELEAEIESLREEIERLRVSGIEQTNGIQSTFAEAQTRRDSTFAEQLESQRESLSDEVVRLTEHTSETLARHSTDAETKLGEIESLKERIEEYVGIAGEETLVGGYSKNAKEDHEAALRWTSAAIVLALGAVGIGIWLVIGGDRAGTDWDMVAGRGALAAATAAVSAFAARQAAEHRHAHREAQHIALQLAALKPFLDDLSSAEDRDQVLKETALKIFGAPRRSSGRNAATSPTAVAQITEAVELVDKIRPG